MRFRALAREVDRLAIHVGGTSYQPASAIAVPSSPDEVAVAEETGGAGVGEAVMAGAGHADDRA
jgi:hypothetical protein